MGALAARLSSSKMIKIVGTLLAIVLPLLYVLHVDSDNIDGLFGIYWTDAGAYLLSAKNAALFGQMHPFIADAWKPELRTPLLHYFALATIFPTRHSRRFPSSRAT